MPLKDSTLPSVDPDIVPPEIRTEGTPAMDDPLATGLALVKDAHNSAKVIEKNIVKKAIERMCVVDEPE